MNMSWESETGGLVCHWSGARQNTPYDFGVLDSVGRAEACDPAYKRFSPFGGGRRWWMPYGFGAGADPVAGL